MSAHIFSLSLFLCVYRLCIFSVSPSGIDHDEEETCAHHVVVFTCGENVISFQWWIVFFYFAACFSSPSQPVHVCILVSIAMSDQQQQLFN